MNGVKGFFESKTVWGGLIAFIASAGALAGYSVSADDMDTLSTIVPSIAGIVGSVIAIYGRIKASKVITTKP